MLYDRVFGFSLIWNDMCLHLSPVVRFTGVCLVIWDDMLGTQNLPKQIRWCNSVWSVCGDTSILSSEDERFLACGKVMRTESTLSLFIKRCHLLSWVFGLDLFFWLFIPHAYHVTKHGALAHAKQVRRERGGEARGGRLTQKELVILA